MNPNPTVQLPGQWSTSAPHVDWLYYFIYWTSVILFVGIVGAMLYFVWKYRRRPGHKAEPTGHNTVIEVTWTIAPLLLLAVLFHWGFRGYMDLMVPPANSLEIRVRAQKWSWDFEYPNGAHTGNVDSPANPATGSPTSGLVVPVNRPVRLVMSSSDVIHSFFVPAFRIKHDAVPGQYNTAWFQATQLGDTVFTCTEYCGTHHSDMHGTVHVLTPERWQQFLHDSLTAPIDPTTHQPVTPAVWGGMIFHQRGCPTCHGEHGEGISAPRLAGQYGTMQHTDHGEVMMEPNYIRESILTPGAKVVNGFQPVMPSFAGQLQDNQIDAVIAFIRSLNPSAAPPAQ